MGDDLPGYGGFKKAGLACCPADAVPEVRACMPLYFNKKGGEGCVRDVIEKVLKLIRSLARRNRPGFAIKNRMNKVAAFLKLVRWPNLVFIALTQVLFQYCLLHPIFNKAAHSTR